MLTGLIGTGGAVLVAGIALIISKFRGHLPGRNSDQIVLTIAVVLMVLGGTLATYIGIGQWVVSVLRSITGLFGPAGPVILVLLGFAVLLTVAVAVFRTATDRALWVAFALPLVCAAINKGIFYDINAHLHPAANQVELMLRTKLGA
ncbi:hypothetical protein AB0K34_14080 [Actinomadura sp. NPDC049382]|uniref:hypothetical protein n=1 Tax=Actinomadura sp. NPDC049382 TaxID=3158220 RepID=UPI003445294C